MRRRSTRCLSPAPCLVRLAPQTSAATLVPTYKIDTFPFTVKTPHSWNPTSLRPMTYGSPTTPWPTSKARSMCPPVPLASRPAVLTTPELEGFRFPSGSLRTFYYLFSFVLDVFALHSILSFFTFRLIPSTSPRHSSPSSSSCLTSSTSHLFSKISPLRTPLVLLHRHAGLSPARHFTLIFSSYTFSAPPIRKGSYSHWLGSTYRSPPPGLA